MNITKTELEGVFILEPKVFGDHRGWFTETFNEKLFKDNGIDIDFVQDNQSFSAQIGTLRGLHFQNKPMAQTKLIRCTKGVIFDVAVDIRKNSPTYKKWVGVELSATNFKQLLVPQGFAHGFMTLTADVEVQYKVDQYYSLENDRAILWNDPEIGVEWPLDVIPVFSTKDEKAPTIEESDHNFFYGEE